MTRFCPACSLVISGDADCCPCGYSLPDKSGYSEELPPQRRRDASKDTLTCVRCGSTRMIPHAEVCSLRVHAKPDALLFKGTEQAQLHAHICAVCGHVELFVNLYDAHHLYKAYRQSEDNHEES